MKKYTDTAPAKSDQELAILQIDALIAAIKALTAKLDADATVTDTDYAALISDVLVSCKDQIIGKK